ncbi:hypothetical protein EVAR_76905_1 [Eumeta japonica]|uniref:Uncharacterized protein n=1 Tax=Eumeta variegata TaxID=151549 RepID=A0A4C1SEP3_EUMVA|nr:hypothetical protein EVAR_76905_1 [Eumeta japonica]
MNVHHHCAVGNSVVLPRRPSSSHSMKSAAATQCSHSGGEMSTAAVVHLRLYGVRRVRAWPGRTEWGVYVQRDTKIRWCYTTEFGSLYFTLSLPFIPGYVQIQTVNNTGNGIESGTESRIEDWIKIRLESENEAEIDSLNGGRK